MPPILRTQKDQPHVDIAGVGRLPGNAVGGATLERAAQSCPALQDDDGQPLEGPKLKSAGKKLADVLGLDVAEVSEDKIAKLPVLNGGFADPPPAIEAAQSDSTALAFAASQSGEGVAGVVDPTTPDEEQQAA